MRFIQPVLVLLFLFVNYSYAYINYESANNLKSIAKRFVIDTTQLEPGETMEVQANPSNTVFEVPACPTEIAASLPKDGNREQASSVELTCNSPQPWHVLVPVDVQIYTKVIIAKHSLPPKNTIEEDDLDFTLYNKNRLYSGYFTKKEDVIGNEAVGLITAGTILTKKNIELPLMVHRNQTVTISAQSNSVVVTMQGIAKTDGALNATIQVYNPSSKRIVEAIVVGPNKAQVTL